MKNLIVGQSGGPTAVINASLSGVIKEALQNECVDNVIGMIHGIEGLLFFGFATFHEVKSTV